MKARNAIAACVLAFCAVGTAQAFDQTKYPDWRGQWRRAKEGAVSYDPSKPRLAQQAPLTPEYQTIFEANLRDQADGGQGIDPTYMCLSPGMPRIMNMYEPMEIVIMPESTHILIQHIHDARRIFTDGRDFPKDEDATFAGYSIGKWVDADGDGRYDELDVETRDLRNPRVYDATGIPFHDDGETVLKERFFADKSNLNVLYDVITSYDHALTRPWTVTKTYVREPDPRPQWRETVCSEENDHVEIGGQGYMLSADGFLMPVKKSQPPPDLRYFKQPRK
jgi:hypothetical protein